MNDLDHLKARLDLQADWERTATPQERATADMAICEEWLLETGAEKIAALKACGHL